MFEWSMLILSFSSCFAGFAAFALSQKRHWRDVTRQPSGPERNVAQAMRYTGIVFLGGGLLSALLRDGPGFGAVLWALELSLAATCVAFLLSTRRQSQQYKDVIHERATSAHLRKRQLNADRPGSIDWPNNARQ